MIKLTAYTLKPASFNPWRPIYIDVANALIEKLASSQFEFLHIGSSSFKVAGKGIIDISILYKPGELNAAVAYLEQFGFAPQHSDTPFPDTRPRKDIAVIYNGEQFNVHAHVIEKGSNEHLNQLAYKTHMLNNGNDRAAYENKKREILASGNLNQDDYGKAKSPFVKQVLNQMNDDE